MHLGVRVMQKKLHDAFIQYVFFSSSRVGLQSNRDLHASGRFKPGKAYHTVRSPWRIIFFTKMRKFKYNDTGSMLYFVLRQSGAVYNSILTFLNSVIKIFFLIISNLVAISRSTYQHH